MKTKYCEFVENQIGYHEENSLYGKSILKNAVNMYTFTSTVHACLINHIIDLIKIFFLSF